MQVNLKLKAVCTPTILHLMKPNLILAMTFLCRRPDGTEK
jgi:hypothetical protein